ncbi:hypothetical protein CALCODRAFT_80442 [Calocera cornea HHB12733]|uniref:Uncharacterized protein n=1 Tax=Calocera cornea HHB12733 TaxID=1353952 RepID=A0A165DF36_9BASI|nr:hypothetical protein CALCODRAFT_80442 [Calocera cornea HHB12733]
MPPHQRRCTVPRSRSALHVRHYTLYSSPLPMSTFPRTPHRGSVSAPNCSLCQKALEHPYLIVCYDRTGDSRCSQSFDYGLEHIDDMPGMKTLIGASRMHSRSRARTVSSPSPVGENDATGAYTFPTPVRPHPPATWWRSLGRTRTMSSERAVNARA